MVKLYLFLVGFLTKNDEETKMVMYFSRETETFERLLRLLEWGRIVGLVYVFGFWSILVVFWIDFFSCFFCFVVFAGIQLASEKVFNLLKTPQSTFLVRRYLEPLLLC